MGKRISGLGRLSYLVYALLLIGVLLYVRFPAAKVERYMVKRVETALAGAEIVPGKCTYVFPTTVLFDQVVISNEKNGDKIVLLENVEIAPVITGLGLEYALAGEVYGGTFRIGLKLAPGAGEFTLDTMELTNMELDRSLVLHNIFQRDLSGSLNFIGTYTGSLDATGGGRLQGVVAVRGGEFPLRQPMLSLERMNIETLDVGVSYDDGVLKLVEGSLKGAELHADFSGDLQQVADRLEAWDMELSGSLVPQQSFMNEKPQVLRVVKRLQKQYRKNALPFRISGGVGNPRFRFGNQ